ncbi:MAG: tetratricopeptide repeat protein [Deltaproteobacteria bacterium]|nr:tetratricopeptide repeat protein [Deltaproteobacteria bacterium]
MLKYGDELLADKPDSVTYLFGTARACYALGDYKRAASLWEGILEQGRKNGVPKLAETYPWVYVYLGLSYAKLGDAAKARDYWREVPMTIGPVYRTIQDQLAALPAKAEGK